MTAQHPLKTFVDTQPKDFLTALRVADALTRFFCGENNPDHLRAGGGMFMTLFAYMRTEGFLYGTSAADELLQQVIATNPAISGADLLVEYQKYQQHSQENIGEFYAASMGNLLRMVSVESPALRPLRKLFTRAFTPLFQDNGVLPALLAVKLREEMSNPAAESEDTDTDTDTDDAEAAEEEGTEG